MAEVDLEKVRELANSAMNRANEYHKMFQTTRSPAHLNDSFYWFGHANAYKGIVAMAELATVVEDELDAEGSCP